ncbi:SPOR domain-containing protein [Thioalkalicoccus limnaeus]|uniref:SPOR domain-containing protein n=1 Tax=Thioalkalicoccus limnaeus TaxID=120681 RepID=A0ABV4BGB3_9GAMM
MTEAAKKRLIGAVALVVLMVIFVPMLFEDADHPAERDPAFGLDGAERRPVDSAPPVETFPPLGTPIDEGELALSEDEMIPFEMGEPADEAPPLVPISPTEPRSPTPSVTQPAAPPAVAQPSPATQPSPPRTTAQPAPPATTTSAPPAAPRSGTYVVQVAAVSTAERASVLEQELRQKGFRPFIERAVVEGRTWYRVRVGPENDRSQAARLMESVKQATGYQGQILRQP